MRVPAMGRCLAQQGPPDPTGKGFSVRASVCGWSTFFTCFSGVETAFGWGGKTEWLSLFHKLWLCSFPPTWLWVKIDLDCHFWSCWDRSPVNWKELHFSCMSCSPRVPKQRWAFQSSFLRLVAIYSCPLHSPWSFPAGKKINPGAISSSPLGKGFKADSQNQLSSSIDRGSFVPDSISKERFKKTKVNLQKQGCLKWWDVVRHCQL